MIWAHAEGSWYVCYRLFEPFARICHHQVFAEICEDQPYSIKSDVWALGCILYELTTLKRAFDGRSLPALVVKILRGRIPPIPARYSNELRSLIQTMLSQSPAQRPSMDQILKLPLMREHLERYADHMMTVSCNELASPAALRSVTQNSVLQQVDRAKLESSSTAVMDDSETVPRATALADLTGASCLSSAPLEFRKTLDNCSTANTSAFCCSL